jgi:predicted SAM-dependent methyltransferase
MTRLATAGLRLHLGCGSTVVSGWENIDKSPGVALARVPGLRPALQRVGLLTHDQANAVFPDGIKRVDVAKGLPYPDGSVSFVYSSHMIEHMARWQGLALTKEIRRVLRPDGRLRFATPNLRVLVDEYLRGERRSPTPADGFMQALHTYAQRPANPIVTVSQRLFTAPHQWVYDAESLIALFEEAGFVDVAARSFRDSELPNIDELEEREESLFVEGRRP